MMQSIRTTYQWYNISEPYVLTCTKCGKRCQRTVSSGYNELATSEDRQRYQEQLEKEARQKENNNKDFICNECILKDIDTNHNYIPFEDDDYEACIETADIMHDAVRHHNTCVKELTAKHKNRIITRKDRKSGKWKEWCIRYIYSAERGYGMHIDAYKINERTPWLTCDKNDQFEFDSNVRFTDQFLEDRQPQ